MTLVVRIGIIGLVLWVQSQDTSKPGTELLSFDRWWKPTLQCVPCLRAGRESSMSPELFVLSLGTVLALALIVAFKVLTEERWQVLAAVPRLKTDRGSWIGLNLTYYGLFVATAEIFAMVILTVPMVAAGIFISSVAALIAIVISLCEPSSRWIARIVERRKYNFTVSGAVAVGMVAVPLAAALVRTMGYWAPTSVVLASAAVAYRLEKDLAVWRVSVSVAVTENRSIRRRLAFNAFFHDFISFSMELRKRLLMNRLWVGWRSYRFKR